MDFTRRVTALFPTGVVAADVRGKVTSECLLEAERKQVVRAAEKRIQDFSAGRHCARAAMSVLGYPKTPLLRDSFGAPLWPTGLTGSISHTDDYCVAVVGQTRHFRGLGVDAERIGRMPPSVWPLAFRSEEIAFLSTLDATTQARVATEMFTAKEAWYKCQYAITHRRLAFRDVQTNLTDGAFHLVLCNQVGSGLAIVRARSGRFVQDEDLVVSGVAIPLDT